VNLSKKIKKVPEVVFYKQNMTKYELSAVPNDPADSQNEPSATPNDLPDGLDDLTDRPNSSEV
jgi:hypothetical protein